MTHLTLHIGQPKAASTSIQRALRDNVDRLADQRITYPMIGGRQRSSAVADFILTHPTAALSEHPTGRSTVELLALPGAWSDLVDQMRRSDCAIVSSELLILVGSALVTGIDASHEDSAAAVDVYVHDIERGAS